MGYDGSIISREVVKSKNGFPVKLYNFKSAFATGAFSNARSAKQYLLDVLNKQLMDSAKSYSFGIGMSWGRVETDSTATKCLDLLRYTKEDAWDINPAVDSRVYKDSVLDTGREVTCETGTIVLGEEGKLRRKCKNLDEFLGSWPDLQSLGPTNDSP